MSQSREMYLNKGKQDRANGFQSKYDSPNTGWQARAYLEGFNSPVEAKSKSLAKVVAKKTEKPVDSLKIVPSRNKREGKYVGKLYSLHYRTKVDLHSLKNYQQYVLQYQKYGVYNIGNFGRV